jgi:hypothetical protein
MYRLEYFPKHFYCSSIIPKTVVTSTQKEKAKFLKDKMFHLLECKP